MGKCNNRSYISTREYSFMRLPCRRAENEKKNIQLSAVVPCGFPSCGSFGRVAYRSAVSVSYKRFDCISFRLVHRPAIARRLSSLKSRRRSFLGSSSRPALLYEEGRGVAWDGTESEMGGAISCCGKPARVFGNCRHVVENSPSRRKA